MEKHKDKLRTICETGKFKILLKAIRTIDELKQGFEAADLSQPLHYFAGRGQFEVVRQLIEKHGCSPKCQNLHGITPLHCACYCGQVGVVKYLVNRCKCDMNVQDKQGVCPLAYTAYCVMKEVPRMSPLNCFRHNEPQSKHVRTAIFLLNMQRGCESVPTYTLNELHVLRLPVYCNSKLIEFMCIVCNLRCNLEDTYAEFNCEVVKCLEIAIDESKWEVAEHLIHTYTNVLQVVEMEEKTPTFFHKACNKGDLNLIMLFLQLHICKPDTESVVIAINRKQYKIVNCLLGFSDHPLLMDRYKTWSSLLSYIFDYHRHDEELIHLAVAATVNCTVMDAESNSPLHLACKHRIALRFIEEYSCYQDVLNNNQELPLHIACREYDNLQMIKLVSSQLGAEVNSKNKNGDTPLHIVCMSHLTSSYYKSNILDCFKYLILDKQCDLNITNDEHELPLHVFLKHQSEYYEELFEPSEREELTKMVSNIDCLKINIQDSNGDTPMHLACKKNDDITVIYLSKFECNLNLINSKGYLPLHYALESSMPLEIVGIVGRGCSLKHLQNNKHKKTPLHIACKKYRLDSDEQIQLLNIVKDESSVNCQDEDGNTPLHYACKNRSLDTVLYLIFQLDGDVNLLNNHQNLPLHYALESHMSIEAIKAICGRCTILYKQNKFSKTPLHVACEQLKFLHPWNINDKKQLLEMISDANNINSQDKDGNTPLHIACLNNDEDAAVCLALNPHCDVNVLNRKHCLPLHYAANCFKFKPLEIVKAVSKGCTLVHMQDNDGVTPLHIACNKGDTDVVKHLVFERNCNPSFYEHSIHIYGNLDIRLACKDENDIKLLEALANEQNVNNKYGHFDYDKTSPLHVACYHQNVLAIKLLVKLNGDTSCQGFSGRTPLHIACTRSLQSVLPLIPGIDSSSVNICDNNKNTALHLAFKENYLDIVQFLLSNFKCRMNIKNGTGELPFHMACASKSLDIVKMVIERCDDNYINDQTQRKDTPLHLACKVGALDIVKFLVEGFDCESSMTLKNNDGKLPVDYACQHSLAMVKLVSKPCTFRDLVAREYYWTNWYDNRSLLYPRLTTLDIACSYGSLDIVQYLITQKGCSLSALEKNHSALGYACGLLCTDGISSKLFHAGPLWLDVVKYLIAECGYNPGISVKGLSVCDFACQQHNFELVKALTVCSIDIIDLTSGNSLLHYACLHDCIEMVQFLVDLGCDQTIVNEDGELAIHIASRISLDITRLLTKCDINSLNLDGETPLHIACKSEKVDIINYLVEDAKCDVNIPNAEGNHPLHIACKQSLKVECLVHQGDVNCQNADEETPLHDACYRCDYDMIKFLLNNPECRADIADEDDWLALEYLEFPPKNETYQNTDRENLLEAVQSLLKRYSSATGITKSFGLHYPVQFAIRMGETEVFEIFFDFSKFDDTEFKRMLYLACECGQPKVVRFLINHGINLDSEVISNEIQNTFKRLCVRDSCLEILKELEPIDISKQDENGDTLLHLACRREAEDVLQYVLQDVDNSSDAFSIQNNRQITPLHLLAAKEISARTLVLIKCDNSNVKNAHGNTPLHLACQHGFTDFAKHLMIVCQCDADIPNDKEELPIHIAARRSLKELVKMLASPDNVQKKTDNGDTPLHIACQQADLSVVELLISLNCDFNIPNKQGDTPFHVAVARSLTIVQKLFTTFDTSLTKTLVKQVNSYGDTALHIACRTADHQTVSYLIESFKCEVDLVNQQTGTMPLHYACERGLLPIVNLVSKCDPSAKIKDAALLPKDIKFMYSGDTPLHVACRKGNIDIIKHLLTSGHIKALKYYNDFKELPVHLAFAYNLNKAIFDLFIAHKRRYNMNARNDCGDTPLHIVCRTQPRPKYIKPLVHKLKCKINLPNKEGNLPLHIVCQGKVVSKSIITTLSHKLSADDLTLPNSNGKTALLLLLQCPRDGVKIEDLKHILYLFLDRLSSKDSYNLPELIHIVYRYQKLDLVEYFYETYATILTDVPLSVLNEACLNSNHGVLKYALRKLECDINIPNATNDLPLHLAAKAKGCMMSTLLLLISKTVNVNHTNNQGNTFLHELYNGDRTFCESEAMTSCLKAKCFDFSIQNYQEQTSLHCMLTAGRCDNLKLVLAQVTIDPDIKDGEGHTLLHVACQANNLEAVQLLLIVAKADPSLEDKKGQAPITLATDPDIIKVLTEHGADPQPLYSMHWNFFERNGPPQPPVNLMVIGHPSVGKTTLIHSIQNEFFWGNIISEKFDHTAGIVPTSFNSFIYGEVVFYDFAGQPEYYASHDAIIHDTIKNIPPIVLIVINLAELQKIIGDQLHYWINFIANRCAGLSDKAHLIIIGSHVDVLERDGISPSEKISLLRHSVKTQIQDKNIVLKDFIHLNCTKSHSDEMSKLRRNLQTSTDALRETGVMHFKSHCFYVLLLQMFKNSTVVTLGRVISTLKLKAKNSKDNPLYVVPSDRAAVLKLCQDLDEKGYLMFIEHPSIMDMSWLILNKVPLLNKVIGSLFAPSYFPQHCPLSYSTGVVPLSWFEKQLCAQHKYPASLSLTFLSRMEYCREITDNLVLESIIKEEDISRLDKYYFFPSLVSLERPTDKWSNDLDMSYKCGWLIQCTSEGDFFSPHFIQALLLRLTFSFTPKKIEYDTSDLETYRCNNDLDESSEVKPFVIKRFCSVWKNGIYWQEESGVKTIVEVIHQRTLVLLMQCLESCEIELIKRRSQIISMTLSAKEEFCSEAKVLEYFIHPKCVSHPLLNLESIQNQLFSFPRVKASIEKKQPCVVNEHDKSVKLEDLLYFEPYSALSTDTNKPKTIHVCKEEIDQLSIFRGRQPPQGNLR